MKWWKWWALWAFYALTGTAVMMWMDAPDWAAILGGWVTGYGMMSNHEVR